MARRPTGLHRLNRPSCCLARAWSWCTRAWWWASTRYAYFYYLFFIMVNYLLTLWGSVQARVGQLGNLHITNFRLSFYSKVLALRPLVASTSCLPHSSLSHGRCRKLVASWTSRWRSFSTRKSRQRGESRCSVLLLARTLIFLTLCETCRAGCCICSARTCAPCTSPSRRPRASHRFRSHAPPHTRTTHTHTHTHTALTKMQHSMSNAIDKEVDQAKHIPTEGHVVVCSQERRAAGTGLGLLRSPQRELLLPTTRPSTWSSLNG